MARDYHFRLRAIRMALGMSIKEAGIRVRCSHALITQYENKYHIGKVYDLQLQDLLERGYDRLIKSRTNNKGVWYRKYIELTADLIEIRLYMEAGVKIPDSLLEESRLRAVSYSNSELKTRKKKDGEEK